MITATQEELALAFTEWERRWRDDPEQFLTDSQKLAESAESYGEACAVAWLESL